MAQLKHEPKKRNPQGKQRVYFCAHPQDYNLFEEISKAILERHNCVVWYDIEPDEPYDSNSWLDNLNEMQLFVMPITTKLLTTPNRALDVEYPYAIKHHIPVLPLMYESGLEELYSKKLGDLQYLDRYNKDTTAISYDEKLTKYLNSVLVNDDLAEKVRSAFDAYIFMSYRKKDRAKAQELMRLIHSNDFCRDIAIWYDEYLVPGENFNNAIEKALKDSQLFALAVTPNLLEKDNYIMQYEYPMAKNANKKILPVELDTTNKELLKQLFNEMPRTVNAYNHELKDSLLDYLHDIAIKDNDNDPKHNYFIGLAYLKGIDVEVDHKRALELITYSAQHDLPEAINTLCDMYNTGEGVMRDYITAIAWRQKLADYYERQYNANPNEDTFINVVIEHQRLGDEYKAVAKLADALSVYKKGLKIANSANLNDINITLRVKSIFLSLIGDIFRAKGNLKEAKQYYQQSLEIDKQLYEETGTVGSRRDLALSYEKLGDVTQANGDLKGAEQYYLQALEIAKQLYEETGTVESGSDLSISYNKLGDICKANGNLKGAERYYLQALEIRKQLYEETGTMESRKDLSVSYIKLGDICQAKGDLKGSEQYYQQLLEIAMQLYEETGTVESRRNLSVSYIKLGDICQAKGDLKGSEQYYLQSLEILKQLYEQTRTVESARDLSISYSKLGDICQANGNLKGAEQYHLQSLDMLKQLYQETGTVQSRRDLAVSYNRLGNICKANGNLKGAEQFYLQSLEIVKQLYEETDTVESRTNLAISYGRLGDICQANDDLKGAEQYYLQSLELRKQLYEETGTVESRRALSVSLNRLGDMCQANDNLKEAEQYYLRSLEIDKQLFEETGTVESARDLSISYSKLGDICQADDDLKRAEQYYLQSLEIFKQLYEQTGIVQSGRDLIAIYQKLVEFYQAIGNQQQVQEYFEKLLVLFFTTV